MDELVPQHGDIVLPKPRYSGFFNTPLDSILRSRGIRHLVFTGIATNVCVESTLRDGFFLEYFGVVLEDATHQAGPKFAQKAALFNIETFLAGSATSKHSATRFLPRPLLISLKEFNDAKIRNYSRWQQRTAGPFVPARWLMAWCMSPVRWLLINIITCCLPMTQRRKPATFWKLSAR